MIAASILSLLFIVLIIVLAFQSKLIPEIIILGSFLLFVLWLTGLIGISIQLYGSVASVNANCQNYVESREYRGASINTLAWLTQINICQYTLSHLLRELREAMLTIGLNLGNCWRAAFSFTLVNTVFYIWMLFMALQVRRGEY